MQDLILFMLKLRNSRTNRFNLTQSAYLNFISHCIKKTSIKPRLVQQDAIIFIRIVCLKSAQAGFCQTFTAHMIKYTRIGSMQVDKIINSFISSEIIKKKANTEKAIP